MSKSLIPAFDSSGVPLSGLSPTWYSLFNAATELSYTPTPAITEIASSGVYSFNRPEGIDIAGIIDLGATATPRYMFYGSDRYVTYAAYDLGGTPLTGVSPTWATVVDVEGNAFTPQPTLIELGLGVYKVARHTGRATGYIDMTASASPRYFSYDSDDVLSTLATTTPDVAPPLTPITGGESTLPIDLMIGDNGELVLTNGRLVWTYGVAATAQQCRLALLAFRGEWFEDLDSGVPWFQEILGTKWNESRVRGYIRDALLGVSTVRSVERLRLSWDNSNREVTIAWTVLSTEGITVEGVTTV